MRTAIQLLLVLFAVVLGQVNMSLADSDVPSVLDRLTFHLFKNWPDDKISEPSLLIVLPLESSPDLDRRRVGFAVSEVLKSRILSAGKSVALVETALVQKAIKERNIQSNRFDNNTAVQIAKVLDSTYVIVGSVHEAMNRYQINLRLLSIVNQQIISIAYEEIPKSPFDEYATVYMIEGTSSSEDEGIRTEHDSEHQRKIGKLGLDLLWANVLHDNSGQFKDATAPVGIIKLWLSNAVALEAGAGYLQQKIKYDVLFEGEMNVAVFFVGTQIRLDRGQRIVPYIGGGGVLLSAPDIVVNREVPPCHSSPGFFTYCTEENNPTSNGNYLNVGLTGYLTENRNWSVIVDYRKINVELNSKQSKTTGLPITATETSQNKIDMDMEFFNIGMGYHFQ